MLDRARLQTLLKPIVGERLADMWRAAGQIFEFGEQRSDTNRRGEPVTRGDFSLKFLGADWRVVRAGCLVFGSSDHSREQRFYVTDAPPDRPEDAEAWSRARHFLQSVEEGAFVVEEVEVGQFADLTIRLSPDLMIQSFCATGQDADLWWFHDLRTDASCLVNQLGAFWRDGE
jgi:hypothetical protein